MVYTTEGTVWPAIAISNDSKALIGRFFQLMDDSSQGIGDILADEIFTSNGSLSAAAGTATGSSEIRRCRDNAWNVIQKRRHVVQRVYTQAPDGSDIMIIGSADMSLVDGRTVTMEFTGRFIIENDAVPGPKLQSYQVWVDSAPLAKALSENQSKGI
ncbi:hypothetical protein BKA63DRAFT_208420 [Paraphoma chrysanthemicola]|nr:hypothetical protein BKA63DRAFT_208420 [Paraphoma chrysanthemicola]